MTQIEKVIAELRSDFMFAGSSPGAQWAAVEAQMAAHGLELDDPTEVAAIIKAALAPPESKRGDGILARVKDCLGWTEIELAQLIEKSKPLAGAYVRGTAPERLSQRQRNRIKAALVSVREDLDGILLDLN